MIGEETRWLFGISLLALIVGYLNWKYPHVLIKFPGWVLYLDLSTMKFKSGWTLERVFGKERALKIVGSNAKSAFAVSAFFAYLAIGSLVLSILGKK